MKLPIAQTLCDYCGADVGLPHAHSCRTTIAKQRREKSKEVWNLTAERLPDENVVVYTKIHDSAYGVRKEQPLKRRGRLWFFPNDSMYVYYVPTHWRYAEPS